jgi:hypothetical protein
MTWPGGIVGASPPQAPTGALQQPERDQAPQDWGRATVEGPLCLLKRSDARRELT